MKIALYGGSFNPPHVGHLLVLSYVLATADVDEVWLMPAYDHPFGKELAPFEERVRMCELLAALFAGRVQVSTVEAEVQGGGRTIRTLEHLVRSKPGCSFRLVVGSDILDERDQWESFERVAALAPLLVIARGGHPHPEARGPEMPEVSSSEIRALLRDGRDASALVPRAVLAHIRERGLYGPG